MDIQNAKPREECGIFGIVGSDKQETSHMVYYGLYALQHRGQESCGIAIGDRKAKRVTNKKALGLVGDVFDGATLDKLEGDMAIGHTRYSTTGKNTLANAQPLTINYIKGSLSIAHNGNISNAAELRAQLERTGAIFQSTSDTEVIAFMLARERLSSGSIEEAISKVLPQLKGSFALLIMSPQKLIAVRDPYGIRPLCMGKRGDATVFASESCAINAIGGEFVRDVKPGEIIIARETGEVECREEHCGGPSALCIFEHIYFARPDSVIDEQSVYEARLEAGRILARVHPADADIVIGVPDSGVVAAIGYSEQSGLPYREGLLRNRYIGRTFIQPTQGQRMESVSIKLNPIVPNVKGKRIVMIDDSIVRGTTMAPVVAMLRRAGAKEIHIRICSPEFLYPCYFGTDIPSRDQLAAVKYTKKELCERLGADSLEFLPLDKVHDIARHSNVKFCDACFSGNYPFEVPSEGDKNEFEDSNS